MVSSCLLCFFCSNRLQRHIHFLVMDWGLVVCLLNLICLNLVKVMVRMIDLRCEFSIYLPSLHLFEFGRSY
jgi:hypothetical protein